MKATVLASLAASLLHPTTTLASQVNTVQTTCQQLRNSTFAGADITLPSDSGYDALREENWSQTAWQSPSCIATPKSTAEVQSIVKLLTANNVSFAIRSGGHSPNPLDANINSGVLISMANFDTTTYDATSGTATIGAGSKWVDVYSALDPYNVTVVGGRVLDVGVGGLMLGSGLSYLSDLYGMACDNVVNYEVVLADGSVQQVNASRHADLFWALKGGANNFGIVTQYRVKTYPIHMVWGGVQVFGFDQMANVTQAYQDYHNTPNKDLYANLVIDAVPTNNTILVTLVYLKPVENPAAYAPFYKLTPLQQQFGVMTLTQLQGAFPAPTLPRWAWWAFSFRSGSGESIFPDINQVLNTAPEVATLQNLEGGTLVSTIQPINTNVVAAGKLAGGNALGLQAVNQTWFALNAGWYNAEDDTVANEAAQSLHGKLNQIAVDGGLNLSYIFMNDANARQAVISGYGATNVERLLAVQKEYDPAHVFQKLVPGGQKLPAN